MNTSGYGGRKLKKSATVFTNDKSRAKIQLGISGDVERFATINPKMVSFRGFPGDSLKQTVKIIPIDKYPFKIVDVSAKKGDNIKFALSEIKQSPVVGYALFVENTKKDTGTYSDTIIVKTDSSIKPEFSVRVYGYIRARSKDQKKTN